MTSTTESNLLAEVSGYLDRIKQYFGEMVKNMYTKEDFLRDYPPSERFNIVFPWEENLKKVAKKDNKKPYC